ncbi:GspE/PulE family protein [Pelomicrobium sp. G1]|uniref:GspE/PulE family protein n=1 Tax=unclassified Pelomicrobium TaxID=2815318 RepID=UPI003F761717
MDVDRAPLQSLITPALVRNARALAEARGARLMEALEELAGLAPTEFAQALAAALRMAVATMDDLHRWTPQWERLPYAEALARECILFTDEDGAPVLVVADPLDETLRPWAEERLAQAFSWRFAHRADVTAYLARHEETLRAMDGVLARAENGATAAPGVEDLSLRSISQDSSPVVKLVRSTLYDALKVGASDVHLESTATGLAIKYRVDGVLTAMGTVAGNELAEQAISRVKVLSELDIAERRVPQDGRFKATVRGREIDFRVSIMPSILGEDAVLRILDKQALTDQLAGLTLDALGFDEPSRRGIRRLSNEPYGMMLVTGPTGSGKTTTLYAAISEVNRGHDKIVTIEDPVEYQLPGVLQIPVNEKKGLTFARGLRSILRHDPDKIMVGEIRDPETAQIAVQAALTGHLVFTTVHANNVFDVIGRFTHMGVDPYSFVSALNGILAQRLVRLTCRACAMDERPGEALLRESGLDPAAASAFRFRVGKGCGQCRGTGYRGRRAIAELLMLDDELRELIVARTPVRRLKEAARRAGTRFLREAAVDLVRQGITTLQEANRVTLVA